MPKSASPVKVVKAAKTASFKKGGTVNAAGNYTKPELRKRIVSQVKAAATQGTGAGHGLAEAEIRPPVAWLAALAGTEAGSLSGFGRGVEIHVALERGPGGTGRQAVDPGRFHREPEPAVERPVAPQEGLPARVRIGKRGGGESQGGKCQRMLGHGAIKAP